jgi:hypothetical protein
MRGLEKYHDEQKARIAQCILDDVTKVVCKSRLNMCISDKVCAQFDIERPPNCNWYSKRRMLCYQCCEAKKYPWHMTII